MTAARASSSSSSTCRRRLNKNKINTKESSSSAYRSQRVAGPASTPTARQPPARSTLPWLIRVAARAKNREPGKRRGEGPCGHRTPPQTGAGKGLVWKWEQVFTGQRVFIANPHMQIRVHPLTSPAGSFAGRGCFFLFFVFPPLTFSD